MAWQKASELDDRGLAMLCLIRGWAAIDTGNNLILHTTRGRTRNAPRWFVTRFNFADLSYSRDYDKVSFRAWSFDEAWERLAEKRIANRVAKIIEAQSS